MGGAGGERATRRDGGAAAAPPHEVDLDDGVLLQRLLKEEGLAVGGLTPLEYGGDLMRRGRRRCGVITGARPSRVGSAWGGRLEARRTGRRRGAGAER